jgi:hypothetical protein
MMTLVGSPVHEYGDHRQQMPMKRRMFVKTAAAALGTFALCVACPTLPTCGLLARLMRGD